MTTPKIPTAPRRALGKQTLLVWLPLILLGYTSFAEDPTETTAGPPVAQNQDFFEKYVRPLFAEHCYECHDQTTGPENGELALDTIAGIRSGGSRGLFLDPVTPENSLLWHSVSYENSDLQMPPSGRLPAADLQAIRIWLEQGAELPDYKEVQEMTPEAAGPPSNKRAPKSMSARNLWSLQPLSRNTAPPRNPKSNWTRQPIDPFVLETLHNQNLQPNPEADPRTLLRRLYLVATGLLPTPQELDQFLNDASVDAYEKAVERVLASPAFGEKAARFWLDLARYTDFTPDWQNPTDRGWIYRDWVISAFNDNRPYDQFVTLQIAADLQPDVPPKDLAALGFLGLSPTYWKELKLAPNVIQQIVADEWDERIDAVSRTFLGLTVSCARCHDHKFDPITMSDYYALAGVFASTQLHEQPLLAPDEARAVIDVRRQLSQLETKIESLKGADDAAEASKLRSEIEALRRSEPNWNTPLAHTLREASLYVVPNGPDATKLEYREQESRDLPIFRRGNPSNPGEVVSRRYLEVFSPTDPPPPFQQGSGRRELSSAIFELSQGLVARVIVNRIWLQTFGQGIVRTPSDFGSQGDPPTHPKLLEFLAAEFVHQNWDLKWLYRQIFQSATWRQSSLHNQESFAIDPENKWLWRMNRRPLEFEQWRDAILQSSGQLDRQMFGPSAPVDDPNNVRRTLYVTIAREELHPILRLHDFPEASTHSPKRSPTITPLQQLFILNSPWMQAQARELANALDREQLPFDERIAFLYRRLFGREPYPNETISILDFLRASGVETEFEEENSPSTINPALDQDDTAPRSSTQIHATLAWQALIQGLFGLNEFAFVD